MTDISIDTLTIKEILLAFDTSPYSLCALDEAVDISYRLEAHLKVLCIEDINLIKAGKNPCTITISPFSYFGKTHTNPIECMNKLQAKEAKKALATAIKNKNVNNTLVIKTGTIVKEILSESQNSNLLILGWAGWQAADFYFSSHPLAREGSHIFPISRIVKMGSCVNKIIQDTIVPTLILHSEIKAACSMGIFYDDSDSSTDNLIYSLRIFDHLFSCCKKGKEHAEIQVFVTNKAKIPEIESILTLKQTNKTITVLNSKNIMQDLISHMKNKNINLLSLHQHSTIVKERHLDIFNQVSSSLLITV